MQVTTVRWGKWPYDGNREHNLYVEFDMDNGIQILRIIMLRKRNKISVLLISIAMLRNVLIIKQ